jgi:hypothetical protein
LNHLRSSGTSKENFHRFRPHSGSRLETISLTFLILFQPDPKSIKDIPENPKLPH